MFKADKHQTAVIKMLFFLGYSAAAAWLTYFYVYLKDGAGLTGFEIGIIASLQQFNNIFVLPVWGILADRYGRKKMLIFSIGASILLLPFFIFLEGPAALTLFVILVTFAYNPIASLIDTIALDYEAQSKGKASYGEFRLWASLGWGASSMLTGIFISSDNLFLIFPVASGMFLITWILLVTFYKPLVVKENLSNLRRGVIWDLLKSERVLLAFFLLVFFYSIFSAPIYLMINVYYLDIGANNKIIGLAFLIQGLCELPFFFFGKRIVDRFGAKNVFLFTMLATAIRMFLYGINHSPQVAIAIGTIHGISVGLFFVSVVSIVHRIIPPSLRSTGQSLFYTFYAVGVAFGNILTGVLFDYFSMNTTMLLNAFGIIVLVLLVLITRKSFTKFLAPKPPV